MIIGIQSCLGINSVIAFGRLFLLWLGKPLKSNILPQSVRMVLLLDCGKDILISLKRRSTAFSMSLVISPLLPPPPWTARKKCLWRRAGFGSFPREEEYIKQMYRIEFWRCDDHRSLRHSIVLLFSVLFVLRERQLSNFRICNTYRSNESTLRRSIIQWQTESIFFLFVFIHIRSNQYAFFLRFRSLPSLGAIRIRRSLLLPFSRDTNDSNHC